MQKSKKGKGENIRKRIQIVNLRGAEKNSSSTNLRIREKSRY